MNSLHTRIGNGLVRILRWSERYTGTDMVYLARGSGWLGVSQLSASIGAFISMYVLANALSPEVFGEYRFFMASFLILSIFALPGMRIALLESTPKNFRNNLIVAYREMVRFGVAGSVVSVGIAFYYVLNNNLALALGFLCIAILLPFFDSSSAFLEYLKALKEFRKVAVYTLIVRTILLALTTSVALLYPKYGWLIFLSFLIGNIAPNLYLHWRTTRRFAGPEETSDPKLTHYAKHLTALAVLGLLAMQLDKIFVWKFIGAEELAIFFIAYTLPQELGRFLQIIPQLYLPKFSIATPSIITKTLLQKILIYLGSI